MDAAAPRSRSDTPFIVAFSVIGSVYVLLIVGMLVADVLSITSSDILDILRNPRIRYAIKLSLISCTISAILSVWVAVPLGYLMSRFEFRGKALLDAILDIPIVLPPVVIGISLLILFSTAPGRFIQQYIPITYAIPAVIIAQFAASAAFAVRTMRVTFDQISPRQEQVAMTLGCSRGQAFWLVVLPQARRGVVTAGTIAWARAMGEFGPVMMFAATTKFLTEVLPSSVFLEFQKANFRGAVSISLLMVAAAVIVLLIVRVYGTDVRTNVR